jgi:hypothetical protein
MQFSLLLYMFEVFHNKMSKILKVWTLEPDFQRYKSRFYHCSSLTQWKFLNLSLVVNRVNNNYYNSQSCCEH